MIIAGGGRSSARFWTWHLQRTDGGQSVSIRDTVGLLGTDMGRWFEQMEAMSAGGRTDNYFYHFNLNPREDEALTPEQLKVAVETTLENLGLEGQPYFLVEHDKDGRSPHFHCIVLRVDLDSGKAISDSHNYAIHMRTADELEQRFENERTERGRGPDGPNPKGHEVQRGKKTGIDPKDVAAELKALWRQADSGPAFAAALTDHSYILARGDRRDLVVIDQAGSDYSLGKKRLGVTAAEVRARMASIDRDALPSVAEARALARERADKRDDRDDSPAPDRSAPADSPKKDHSAFERLAEDMLETVYDIVSERDPEPAQTPAPEVPPNPVQELTQLAEEAEPMLADLGAAAVAAETHDAPAERSEFDRFAIEIKQAMRKGGGEPMAADGWRWLAKRAPESPSRPEPSLFGRFVRRMKDAMRSNAGEPDSGNGLSFWQRSAALFSAAIEQAGSWAQHVYRDVADRFSQARGNDPDDPGMER